MDFNVLSAECAPWVAPQTMAAIVKTESQFNPLAININAGAKLERQPASKEEAVVTAKWLIANKYNIDLGLGQVNSTNLAKTNLSVEDAFDSCKNLAAAATTCVRALNSYVSISAENTRAGVITSFRSRLELWINPLVDAATSANDFDLRDVRKKRMSIYLGVTPDNLERMAPLLNLFFQQLIDLNTRELPSQNDALKYSCILLMDEFTSIGNPLVNTMYSRCSELSLHL